MDLIFFYQIQYYQESQTHKIKAETLWIQGSNGIPFMVWSNTEFKHLSYLNYVWVIANFELIESLDLIYFRRVDFLLNLSINWTYIM